MATVTTTTNTKVKCKYWEKCYRKDPNHKTEFLHPGDVEEDKNKGVATSTSDTDATDKGATSVAMDTTPSPNKTPKKRVAHEMSQSDHEDDEPAAKKPAIAKVKSIQEVIGGSINNKKTPAAAAASNDDEPDEEDDEEQEKCKYWEKCYRKDLAHLKKYLHPTDKKKGKGSPKKTSKSEEEPMDTSDGAVPSTSSPKKKNVKPKLDMEENEEHFAGGSRYKIKLSGGVYSCTCRAWQNQSRPASQRTCAHLQDALGDEFETERVGKLNLESTKLRDDAPVSIPSGSQAAKKVLLAHKWDEDSVDPTGWWMSEKLDGVRAYWDGKKFWSRLGNPFDAPKWFTKDFPKNMALDGELFGGRSKFQQTVKIIKNHESDDWKKLKYHVFDAPYLKKDKFEQRVKIIKDYFDTNPTQYVHLIEHTKCKSKAHLLRDLDEVLDKGGEGLMIREPGSSYEFGRSHSLLKIKKFYDAEAIVIGHEKGSGKNFNKCGALLCRMECGKVFKVGTGLSDKDRAKPPKIGSIITYKFQELTNSGSPRFPSYLGIRIDMDAPKDAVIREVKNSDD